MGVRIAPEYAVILKKRDLMFIEEISFALSGLCHCRYCCIFIGRCPMLLSNKT